MLAVSAMRLVAVVGCSPSALTFQLAFAAELLVAFLILMLAVVRLEVLACII